LANLAAAHAQHSRAQVTFSQSWKVAVVSANLQQLFKVVACACRTAATNIFEKQDGEWKMVLHHGGPIPTASSV